jgi:tetratricopeptide (TPR) repeat protein
MRFKGFLIIFACLYSLVSFSQSSTKTERNIFKLTSISLPDSLGYNTSVILQEIALSNNQNKSSVNLNFHFSLCQKYKKGVFYIGIFPEKLAGSTRLKDLNLKDILYPTYARCVLNITKDRYLKKQLEIQKIPVIPGDTAWSKIAIDPDLLIDSKITIEDVSFYYSDKKKTGVLSHFEMVHDYYASSAVLDSLIKLSFGYNLEEGSDLNKNIDLLFALENDYRILRKKTFVQDLKIDGFDPAGFLSKINILERRLNRIRTLTKQLAFAYGGETTNENKMFDHYFDLLKLKIKWAGSSDHYFKPSFYALFNVQLQLVDFEIYNDYQYALDQNESICLFFKKSLDFADFCMQANLHNLAMKVLGSCQNFAPYAKSCKYVKAIDKKYAEISADLYDSYLRVAEKAIQGDNFSIGIEYIKKAGGFLKTHSAYISDGEKLKHLNQMLANRYFSMAEKGISRAQYGQAMHHLNELKRLSREYAYIELAEFDFDSTYQIAKQGVHQDYLSKASHNFNQNDYPRAREYLDKAESIEQNEGANPSKKKKETQLFTYQESYLNEGKIKLKSGNFEEAITYFEKSIAFENPNLPHNEIRVLIKDATSKLFGQKLKRLEIALYHNQYKEALDLLAQLKELEGGSDCVSEAELQALNKFKIDFRDLACDHFWKAYETNAIAAFQAIDRSDFIRADSLFDQAIKNSAYFSNCPFNDSIAFNAKGKFHQAAVYQKKTNEVSKKMFTIGFRAVIPDFVQLEKFYRNNKLADLDVKPQSLKSFLYSQKSTRLYLDCTEYFISKNNGTEAIEYLILLIDQGYLCKNTRALQKDIATICFNSDLKNKKIYHDIDIQRYTEGDPCLGYFVKRYKYLAGKNGLTSILK